MTSTFADIAIENPHPNNENNVNNNVNNNNILTNKKNPIHHYIIVTNIKTM